MSKQNACVIRMHAITNDVPYINLMTLLVNGKKLINLDRDRTEYDFDRETGRLDMTWRGVYIWTSYDQNYDIPEETFRNSEVVDIEIEDDAPEGYEFQLEGVTVNGVAIPVKLGMAEAETRRNTSLMEEVIKYCTLCDMFDNMNLYANGHKYSSDFHPDAQVIVIPILDKDMVRVSFDDPSEAPTEAVYYDCGPCDVRDYLEYCNPDTVSMSFEGYFNSAYNGYYGSSQTEEDITDIAEQYGLYPEQGHSWNLAFYE